jgi:predicted nucleic acid-binding Zn ribbon protein
MAKREFDKIPTRDDISMKQAVEKWLDVYRLRQKFDVSSIVNAWPEIIGPYIAKRTQNIYVRDKKLFVKVESAVVKHELTIMRRQIVGRVNEYIGQVIVEDMVIL